MSNLIKSELFKLSKSFSYKLLVLCAFGIGMIYGISPFITGSDVTGYYVLTIMPGFVLFHSILASIFTGSFICSEFTNRTYQMSLSCGLTRCSVYISKLVVFITGLFLLLLVDVIIASAIVSIGNGFGREITVQTCIDILKLLFYYLIISLAMGGFFAFLASFIKNSIGMVSTGICVTYLLMYMTANYKDSHIFSYTYVYQYNQFLDWELNSSRMSIWFSVITFVFSIVLSVYIFVKGDLK